jgi:hypothetical protein
MIASALLLSAMLAADPPAKACPPEGVLEVSSPSPALLLRPQDRRGDSGAQTLGSLPRADLQLTVLRSVAGCALPTVVREKVEGDGRFTRPR